MFQSPLYRVNVKYIKGIEVDYVGCEFQSPLYRVNVKSLLTENDALKAGFNPLYIGSM